MNAQGQQTPTTDLSFFVASVTDYELITISNQLMEQTRTNAEAFVNAAIHQRDTAVKNLTNNISFELFADGTGVRGNIGSATGTGPYVITLSNIQQIVQFELGMTLQNVTISAGSVTINAAGAVGTITNVNRSAGIITVSAATDASWATAGNGLVVAGDIVAGAISTTSMLGLCGLAAWVPKVSPTSTPFWGVDRSVDATRLGGLRYDASSFTIEEGLTNALALMSREGAMPDLAVIDFASYASLVNSLGAKVSYVQINHDEVEVAFDGIRFQSAYGPITVLADRSCPPLTCYLLQMDTWKLRTSGKMPHILTYGMEGLEGIRVSNADALELRMAYYGNLICSAPGYNCVVSLSA